MLQGLPLNRKSNYPKQKAQTILYKLQHIFFEEFSDLER